MPPRACPDCAAAVPSDASFCPACGARTPTEISRETGEVARPVAPDTDERDHRERLARALGDAYQLSALLGRGGFAEVHRAHERKLKRDVAVKTLRFDLHPTATLLARFQREAEAMAQLRHPNVIPVYAVGEGEGLAYFIMPLIEGGSLRELLEREGRLAIEEARRILAQVADALAHAHDRGMVHRDVKPDNVLLEGLERRVLVMDFGIAKAADMQGTVLTGTGMIVGTPHYMSPEQASGDHAVDARSDIYSLGVVGYQMLAGELPFTATSLPGIIIKHVTEPAPPVTGRRGDCPDDLADAIARCLAKDPAERFPSAAALRDTLAGGGQAPTIVRRARASRPVERLLDAHTRASPTAYRRAAMLHAGLGVAAIALDLVPDGRVDFFPLVLVASVGILLFLYGKLWMAGFGWRDVLHGGGAVPGTPTGVSQGTPATVSFGERAGAVQQARRDRAIIVGHLARLPRAEKETLGDVAAVADGLLARVRALAQQLHRMDRSLAAAGAGARDAAVRDQLEGRRTELERELDGCAVAVGGLRSAIEQAMVEGVAGTRELVTTAVTDGKRLTR